MTNPQAEPPAEPADAPEKRIRRGCLFIILLLTVGIGINFLEYRLNIVSLVGGALLLFAIIVFLVVSREGKR